MEPPGVRPGPDDHPKPLQGGKSPLDGPGGRLEALREGGQRCAGLAACVVIGYASKEDQEAGQGGAVVNPVSVHGLGDFDQVEDIPRTEGVWRGIFPVSGFPQLSHFVLSLKVCLWWDGSPNWFADRLGVFVLWNLALSTASGGKDCSQFRGKDRAVVWCGGGPSLQEGANHGGGVHPVFLACNSKGVDDVGREAGRKYGGHVFNVYFSRGLDGL